MSDHALSGTGDPWLELVGLSEQGWSGLPEDARAAVARARLVIGGQRHLALVPAFDGQQRLVWPAPIHDGRDTILARRGEPVCVLASGDPFWFGIGGLLSQHLAPAEMRVWPAPSAFSLAAARLGWSLQDLDCLSVLARDPHRLRPRLAPGRRLLVLSEDETSPAVVARLLTDAGFGASRLVVLEALGGPDEACYETTARAWSRAECARLNTLAIECHADSPEAGMALTPGRPEVDFDHDDQISKREVRAVILARLAPRPGEHLWDLGAGSGSVAVEWLLTHPANQATAVEQHPERLERARANARNLGAGSLTLVQAETTGALAGLAAPDAIFIGGGLTAPGLLARCWTALPAGGRLVATAVTTEGEAVLARAQDDYGGTLTRLAVDRSEPLGRFTGWQPLRPVTLWAATRPSDLDETP